MSADRELLDRYSQGDARAMDELVDRHGSAVYNFVRRFLGRDGHVDDVVQEVWLRVLRASAGFDGRSRFTTWLFSVARNACIDTLRKRKRLRARQSEDGGDGLEGAEDPGPPVHERVSRKELSALVDEALLELPDDLREVFLLREQTDMSFTEIAEALSLPRETAKSRMRYAMLRIRKTLRARLGEESVLVDCEAFQVELPDLIYGELHPDAQEGVESHLASCTDCAGLTAELKAVRSSLTQAAPPRILGAQIKLAARDHLLESAPFQRGGNLHLITVVILAACIGIAGFGLGVAYDSPERASRPVTSPVLDLPDDPEDVPDSPSEWIDPPTSTGGLGPVPRAPEAWQRVLFDAGSGKFEAHGSAQAREFFRRSAAVAPEGALAAAARVGAAECSLRLGRLEEAQRILNEVEAAVRGGTLNGSARLLQRIHDLQQELRDG